MPADDAVMHPTDDAVDLDRGTVTDVFGLTYGFLWSWTGAGRGKAALGAGDPNGPYFEEGVFTIHHETDGPWVKWQRSKGESRWRPDRDEDELDYVPKPEADVWDALERLVVADMTSSI